MKWWFTKSSHSAAWDLAVNQSVAGIAASPLECKQYHDCSCSFCIINLTVFSQNPNWHRPTNPLTHSVVTGPRRTQSPAGQKRTQKVSGIKGLPTSKVSAVWVDKLSPASTQGGWNPSRQVTGTMLGPHALISHHGHCSKALQAKPSRRELMSPYHDHPVAKPLLGFVLCQ